ncbi:LacI family DNA-binding transcriptional regulator [Pusillimonas sp. ANT_WB101]|uniref:LacI family DNA-binding transcriptional regulator n=1 Tax=Pusillimonas sp. ANT_WB101 TaxID=2597356 RepID=UPI0011EFDD42|nr:LacI family DNA-binding transcriptional regulator [Pusillimonas sp. ANT_WB101]KAA0888452.1 LacI family transcriptional regulator [Pusillimonas sp. ANT_WB101]
MSDIRRVAALAGCSIATVSRCFNEPHLVREKTRERILAIASQERFRPNLIGRQLRRKQTGLVGVMLPSLTNPIFADCAAGIEQALETQHKRMLLTTTQYEVSKESQLIEILLRQQVDGLLLTVADTAHCDALDLLARENVPYVLMYNHTEGFPSVSIDDRVAARDAIEHLLNAGHQHIAMIAGYVAASDRSRLRYQGYEDAMFAAGHKPLPLLEVDFDARTIETSLQHWLDNMASAPTAVFCSTDLLALEVIKLLRERGVHIPRDMSIIGFDGLKYGQLIEPTLTTISQPNHEIGRRAAERLLARLDGTDIHHDSLFLDHVLLERKTVGAPSLDRRR